MSDEQARHRARRERQVRLAWRVVALVGLAAGIQTLWLHLTLDPLADVHAYFDAGARLNAGLPLYPVGADTNAADFYRYPPLLAIAFRPLALLPFPVAATIWEVVVVVSLAATIWWLGPRRGETWIAAGVLASPIAWSVVVGQAQVPVTFLTAVGTPAAIALAANVKVFPAMVCLWWLGRRQWRSLVLFAVWMAGLGLLQLLLEPQATMDFFATFGLQQVGEVRNLSPYAVSPILWIGMLAVGVAVVLRLAPSRWGWAAAATLSVVATPRLLSYVLMTLLATLRQPGGEERHQPRDHPAAEP